MSVCNERSHTPPGAPGTPSQWCLIPSNVPLPPPLQGAPQAEPHLPGSAPTLSLSPQDMWPCSGPGPVLGGDAELTSETPWKEPPSVRNQKRVGLGGRGGGT